VADAVTRLSDGIYKVERNGRITVVYVTGAADEWWAFANGRIYRAAAPTATAPHRMRSSSAAPTQVTAPMPATVVKVAVAEGDRVRRGDTLVVLDAMKMEMPLRADVDSVVKAVRCRAGELVQADAVLVELVSA
jgi:biotin carboxyl carrier protein